MRGLYPSESPHGRIATPNLDRFGSEGIVFREAGPTCGAHVGQLQIPSDDPFSLLRIEFFGQIDLLVQEMEHARGPGLQPSFFTGRQIPIIAVQPESAVTGFDKKTSWDDLGTQVVVFSISFSLSFWLPLVICRLSFGCGCCCWTATQAYAGYTVCAPSRTAFFTGRHSGRCGRECRTYQAQSMSDVAMGQYFYQPTSGLIYREKGG